MVPRCYNNTCYNKWQSRENEYIWILMAFFAISENVFSEKVVLLGVKEFHGLQDDLKIIWKNNPNPGRYHISGAILYKKRRQCLLIFLRKIFCENFIEFYSITFIINFLLKTYFLFDQKFLQNFYRKLYKFKKFVVYIFYSFSLENLFFVKYD